MSKKNTSNLIALRELRLYHWQTALYFRSLDLNESADFHIGFVQILNDFFPVGDTAEHDAEARDRAHKVKPVYNIIVED